MRKTLSLAGLLALCACESTSSEYIDAWLTQKQERPKQYIGSGTCVDRELLKGNSNFDLCNIPNE